MEFNGTMKNDSKQRRLPMICLVRDEALLNDQFKQIIETRNSAPDLRYISHSHKYSQTSSQLSPKTVLRRSSISDVLRKITARKLNIPIVLRSCVIGNVSIKEKGTLSSVRRKISSNTRVPLEYCFVLPNGSIVPETVEERLHVTDVLTNGELVLKKKMKSAGINVHDVNAYTLSRLLHDSMYSFIICRRIVKKFHKAQNEDLSGTIDTSLKFVEDIAEFIINIPEKDQPNMLWFEINQDLIKLEETIHTIVKSSKFDKWFLLVSNQKEVGELMTSILASFRIAVKININFDFDEDASLSNELRRDAGDAEKLKRDESRQLRLLIGKLLGLSEAEVLRELNDQVMKATKHNITPEKESVIGITPEKESVIDFRKTFASNENPIGRLKQCLNPQFQEVNKNLIKEHCAKFTHGTREWALEYFDKWVSETDTHRVCIVTANPGIGKTTIASILCKMRQNVVVAHHFCRYDDVRSREPKAFLLSLAYQLALSLPEYKSDIEDFIDMHNMTYKKMMSDDYSLSTLFSDFFDEPLNFVFGRDTTPRVILIDGLDECYENGRYPIVNCISKTFHKLPPWLKIYVTTRKNSSAVMNQLKSLNPVHREMDEEDNVNDIRTHFARALNITRNDPKDSEVIKKFMEKSNGLCIYTSMVDRSLKSEDVSDMNSIHGFPNGLDELLSQDMFKIFKNEKSDLLVNIVYSVMSAREPLQKNVLCKFAKCEEKDIDEILDQTSFFLQRNNSISFFHKIVKDWFCNYYDNTRSCEICAESDSNRYMAERCMHLFEESSSTSHGHTSEGDKRINDYVVSFIVAHLCEAGMSSEAHQLILNTGWLIARSTDEQGIVKDLLALKGHDRVIEIVWHAVVLSLDGLKDDRRRFSGLLVGKLLSFTLDGKEDCKVEKEVRCLISQLKVHDYGYGWWCPTQATWHQEGKKSLRKLSGHTNSVQSVALSNDGLKIVSGAWDHTARIWDVNFGTEIKSFVHDKWVNSVAWSCDDLHIATGDQGGIVRAWSLSSGSCKMFEGHTKSILSVNWYGNLIVSGSKDNTIRVWNFLEGDCKFVLDGNDGWIFSVMFSLDGSRLASGSACHNVHIYDVSSGDCEIILRGHSDWVRSVVWTNDERVVSGSADNTIRIWNSIFGECEQILSHGGSVTSLAYCYERIVSCSTSSTIKIWDEDGGICKKVLQDQDSLIWSVALSKDGKRIVSGSTDKMVRVWDGMVEIDQGLSLLGHTGSIWSVTLSNDGKRVISGSADKTIIVWDAKTGNCKRCLQANFPVWSVDLSPDNRNVASGTGGTAVEIWSVSTGKHTQSLTGHLEGPIWSIAWSSDGKRIASGAKDKTVRIWNVESGTCESVLQHDNGIRTLSWTGESSVVSGSGCWISIWNISTGESMKKFKCGKDSNGILSLRCSPDGTQIVTGSTDSMVRIWGCADGTCQFSLTGHTKRVNAVTWSNDGKQVVSGSTDKSLKVWDVTSGVCTQTLKGHTGLGVYSVRWSHDGKHILSSSTDKTVRLWDVSKGMCDQVLKGHTGLGIYTVSWSPDGTQVVAGSRDRTVQIWNATTGNCDHILKGHTNWVFEVGWSKDGTQVVSIADDNTVRIWDTESGECKIVLECSQTIPYDFPLAPKLCITRDLSTVSGEDAPAGMPFDKVQVLGGKACAWEKQSVHFYILIDDTKN